MADIIQIRRGTSAQWTATNPVLADGELGFETDTKKGKLGNGVDTWSVLTYSFTGVATVFIDQLNSASAKATPVDTDKFAISDSASGNTLKSVLWSAIKATLKTYFDGFYALIGLPQNSRSANYTLVLGDNGKHIFHPSADTTARTWTIPANASVAFPIGSAVTFVNQNSGGDITIAITTDTLRLAGDGSTGSKTLTANGVATAVKVTATEWIISGTNLS